MLAFEVDQSCWSSFLFNQNLGKRQAKCGQIALKRGRRWPWPHLDLAWPSKRERESAHVLKKKERGGRVRTPLWRVPLALSCVDFALGLAPLHMLRPMAFAYLTTP